MTQGLSLTRRSLIDYEKDRSKLTEDINRKSLVIEDKRRIHTRNKTRDGTEIGVKKQKKRINHAGTNVD